MISFIYCSDLLFSSSFLTNLSNNLRLRIDFFRRSPKRRSIKKRRRTKKREKAKTKRIGIKAKINAKRKKIAKKSTKIRKRKRTKIKTEVGHQMR